MNNNSVWNTTKNDYPQSTSVPVQRKCFAFSATNVGDTVVEINGRRLFPSPTPATDLGDSRSWGEPTGKIYKGNIEVIFIAPIGAAPLVEIEQSYYVDENEMP